MTELFLDASFAIALSAPSDQHHARAVELAGLIESQSDRLITTHAVLLEIGNALARQRYRGQAIELLRAIHADPSVEVVPLSELLYNRAFELYQRRRDKDWGLTDCVSFELMTERGLQDALTADDHFRQAGFRALLTEA
jgi:predicted nucleic acid-binding protein